MIKAEVKSNIVFPKEFITQDDLTHIANKFFIPLLRDGIESGVGVDGAPFPQPEPSTVKRGNRNISKRIFTNKGNIRASAIGEISRSGLAGFSKKVLIDTGKLQKSFYSEDSGKMAVAVKINGERQEVGKALQIDGIKTKRGRKFYKFFGITDGMEKNAMEYAATKSKEICRKFNGKE